jgi:hypothetical protein
MCTSVTARQLNELKDARNARGGRLSKLLAKIWREKLPEEDNC